MITFRYGCFALTLFLIVVALSPSSGQERTVGLFMNTEEAHNGYTLFSNSTNTYLIDNCGFMVHQWPSVHRPGLGVYLLEDGSILRAGSASGVFNAGGAGGAFEKISWDGEVLWSDTIAGPDMHAHHDIEPLPNGNFLALVWTRFSAEEALAAGRLINAEMWMERIVEIKMVGVNGMEIVWEWNLQDHLVQDKDSTLANYGVVAEEIGKLDINYIPDGEGVSADWVHVNAIDYNAELDQIAISSRDMSEIWIIDHSTTTEEASTSEGGNSGHGGDFIYRYGNPQVYQRGTEDDRVFFGQHNVEWIPSGYPHAGMLSVFNNLYAPTQSQVVRWEAPVEGSSYETPQSPAAYGPQDLDWSFADQNIFSQRISGAQFLENGNVLVCAGGMGKFVEYTEEKALVWEYINPIKSSGFPTTQGDAVFQNSTFRALRYSPDHPAFEGRELVPIRELEAEPFESDCVLFDGTLVVDDVGGEPLFRLLSNVIQNKVDLMINGQVDALFLVDPYGQRFSLDTPTMEGRHTISIADFPSGAYWVVAVHDGAFYTESLVIF